MAAGVGSPTGLERERCNLKDIYLESNLKLINSTQFVPSLIIFLGNVFGQKKKTTERKQETTAHRDKMVVQYRSYNTIVVSQYIKLFVRIERPPFHTTTTVLSVGCRGSAWARRTGFRNACVVFVSQIDSRRIWAKAHKPPRHDVLRASAHRVQVRVF